MAMAKAMWVMAMAVRLAVDKEGKSEGSKGDGDGMRVAGNEEGIGNGNKGGGQTMIMATKRLMVTATRVAGKQRQWQSRTRMTVAAAMAMNILMATAMVGGTYNNQLKVLAIFFCRTSHVAQF
jgi:hypothetical protein